MVQNDMSNKKVGNCIKASTCSVYSTPWPHSTAGTPTKTRSHHLTQLTTPPAQPPHSDTLSNAFILHRNPEEMVGLGWSKPPPPSTCQVISNWFWTHAQPQRLHLGELTTMSQKSYTFYVTCYCEMDRRGNKWSWINHNGRKLQRILTRGEAKHTELYSDPLQAYKRRTFNSAAFLAKETFISVSVLLRKERMVHDCDELLEDSPYSDSLLSCHPMLYNLRKQLMFTHWWAVLKCCRTFFFKPSPCSDSLVSCHPML